MYLLIDEFWAIICLYNVRAPEGAYMYEQGSCNIICASAFDDLAKISSLRVGACAKTARVPLPQLQSLA